MRQIAFLNAQRTRKLNTRFLRRVTCDLLERKLELSSYELAIHFISKREMAELNQTFLQHAGSTDVITFDLREGYGEVLQSFDLAGEIYISVADAIEQARQFSTRWTHEIARYVVHGILHLQGFDDRVPEQRRKMKREENRLVAALAREFALKQIGG
jgi:probable rRNA maturation factor